MKKLTTRAGNPVKFRHRHPHFVRLVKLTTVVVSTTAVLSIAYVREATKEPIALSTEMLTSPSVSSTMYDTAGNVIWKNNVYAQRYVEYKDIPKEYIDFLLATEDAEFFEQEYGISLKGFLNGVSSKAMNMLGKDVSVRGGSTIEQQLVKMSSDAYENRTISQKFREMETAYRLTKTYSKEKILELYVNKMELGENSVGANTVAYTYYGQTLKEIAEDKTAVGLSKLAIIAGLGQAPTTYNLYDNPENAEGRRRDVVQSAYNEGKLTKKQAEEILKIPIQEGLKERYWQNNEVMEQTIAHNAFVVGTLDELKEQGFDPYSQSMEIHTSLDSEKDNEVRAVMDNDGIYQPLDDSIGRTSLQQSATTVVDNTTGKIVAQFGGRHQTEPLGLNRASQQTRSSGSIIKPFLSYAPAIEYLGQGSGYSLDSSNYQYAGTNIIARNYGGYVYGNVPMYRALRLSLNTTAIRELDQNIGSDRAKTMLKNLGLDVKDYYGGQDALGLHVSTEQIAGAMSALANYGMYQKPSHINYIATKEGRVDFSYPKTQAMHDSTAYILLKILEGVTKSGGSALKADIPEYQGYATKTGTVGYDGNDGIPRPDLVASDVWIGGTTKNYAIVVWSGYDSPNLQGHWVEESNNAKYAIYNALTRYFNNGRDVSDWNQPSTVSGSGGDVYTPTATYEPVNTYKPLFSKDEKPKSSSVEAPKIDGEKTNPNLEKEWEAEKAKIDKTTPSEFAENNKIYTGE